MVDTVRRETLRAVASSKLQPTLLTGTAGRVNVGGGMINTPKSASPTRLQYIPQPTQLGRQVGNDVAQIADMAGKIALNIAIKNAENKATVRASKGTTDLQNGLMGTKEQPGLFMLTGQEYVDGYGPALEQINQYVEGSAASIEDSMERSHYVTAMTNNAKVLKKQMATKWMAESKVARENAYKETNLTNVNNAVAMAHDPVAFNIQLGNAIVVKESQGFNTQMATDATLLSVQQALLGVPKGHDILNNLENSGVFAAMSGEAQQEFAKNASADLTLQAANIRNQKTVDDKAKEDSHIASNKELMLSISSASSSADRAVLVNDAVVEAMRNDPTGYENQVQKIEAFAKVMDRTDNVPLTMGAEIYIGAAETKKQHPMDMLLEAENAGIRISEPAAKGYIKSFYASANPYVEELLSNWNKEAQGYFATQKGISSDWDYFVTTPKGKSMIATLRRNLVNDVQAAFLDSGAKGAQGVVRDSLNQIKTPGFFASDIHEAVIDQISLIPQGYSLFGSLLDIGQTAAGEAAGVENTTLPEMVTAEHLEKMILFEGIDPRIIEALTERNPDASPEDISLGILTRHYASKIKKNFPRSTATTYMRLLKGQIGVFNQMVALGKAGVSTGPAAPAPAESTEPEKKDNAVMDEINNLKQMFTDFINTQSNMSGAQ